MEDEKSDSEKLIEELIPKISEYFSQNKILTKSNIKQLVEFLEFPIIEESNETEIEEYWQEISTNSDEGNLTQELFITNLTQYINNHSKELFEQESISDDITKFLDKPVQLIEDIDTDNELMFELYRLLATVDFSENQDVPLISLEEGLNEYKFINLNKDTIYDLIQELIKEKSDNIKQYDFLEIMEKMGNEYQYKLETIAQKKVIFVEEDLDKPELNNFIDLLTFIKILLKISDSVLVCHERSIKVIKSNEILNAEYLNRNFIVLVNNLKLYFYEIMRIYYEQKQKFEYYICANNSKITILKQENRDLSEQLKAKDYDNNDKMVKELYDDIRAEKNKSEELYNENQELKLEISNNNDKMYEYDNKIREMKIMQDENEAKINKLNRENELQKEKYKNVFNQLNSFILNKKEEEQRLKESIEKINLSPNLLYLVNMDKVDIISLFNEKNKYFTSLGTNNKVLQNKLKDLEKEVLQKTEEIKDLNYNNSVLTKKNQMLQNEIEETKKEMQEKSENAVSLSNVLDDKVDREDYDNLESQLNEEKEKNFKLKKNINTLNEEISKKEEDIIRSKNQINSQENIIKENENKINNLNEQMKQNEDKFNELMNKYKNLTTTMEENLRKSLYNNIMEQNNDFSDIYNNDQFENEKIELNNKINNLEKIKIELEKNLSDFEAKNNTLNNKIKNLENELNTIKGENEILLKEKNELNNLLKEEKKLGEKMKSANDLLIKENTKIELLSQENKKLSEEIDNQKNIIRQLEKDITNQNLNLEQKENKIINLTQEIESLKTQYDFILNKYNSLNTVLNDKEKAKEEALKNIEEKYLFLKNLLIEEIIKKYIDKDKLYLNEVEENKNLKKENSNITSEIDQLKLYLEKNKDLLQKYKTKLDEIKEAEKKYEIIYKERNEYKLKYNNALEIIIKKNKEPKLFKSTLLARVNTSIVNIKNQPNRKKNIPINNYQEKIYDYLCLRTEKKIINKLKDTHWDRKTVFNETIRYINKNQSTSINCILFITNEYFYLFNYDYICCFESPLIEMNTLSITKKSNYVAFSFQKNKNVIFELFRVLELVNYMRLLKARQRSLKFSINSFNTEQYINTQSNEIIKNNNFIECLYYGKASFSGRFDQIDDEIFSPKSENRFGALCEIGLVILDSPVGNPLNILNLLFAEISRFNTKEGKNGLSINIKGNIYNLVFDSDKLREQWENKIKEWKQNNLLLS